MPNVDSGAPVTTCYQGSHCGNCDHAVKAGCRKCIEDNAVYRCIIDGFYRAADSVCPHGQ